MPPPATGPPRTKVELCQLAVRRAPRPFLNRPAWNSSSWRGRPPRLLAGRAVEEIELGHARADQHRIGEMPGVVERELKPSGAAAARRRSRRGRRRSRRGRRRRLRRRRRRRPRAGRARPGARGGRCLAPAAAAALRRRPASGRRRRRPPAPWPPRPKRPRPWPGCGCGPIGRERLKPQRSSERSGAGEIDRPGVDEQQPAVGVALEAVGEGRLDLGGRGREGGDGVDDPARRVIGGERQVLLGERPQGRAELPHPPVVGDQSRIAAVDPGHLDRLAADEVEHPDARSRAAPDRRAAASRARRPRR